MILATPEDDEREGRSDTESHDSHLVEFTDVHSEFVPPDPTLFADAVRRAPPGLRP